MSRTILLDESVPIPVYRFFPSGTAWTVEYMGWKGLTNGRLMKAAAEARFSLLVTADQSIAAQQNLDRVPIAILMLWTNKLSLLTRHREAIVAAAENQPERSVRLFRP